MLDKTFVYHCFNRIKDENKPFILQMLDRRVVNYVDVLVDFEYHALLTLVCL